MRLTQQDLPEQLTYWNSWHRERGASGDDEVHRELRRLFLDGLHGRSAVLDLGCGQGHDLRAMVRAGHRIAGLDFSPVAIRRARKAVYGWHFLQRRKND